MADAQLFADAVKWDLIEWCVGQGLDLGCGDARPHDWFVGVDKVAGTTTRGPNMLMDARELKIIASESQDFVFSSYLLQELAADEKNDMQKILAEWWRVLKPEGYLVLFLPTTEHCTPKGVVDWMKGLKPWQMCDARVNGEQFFHVYRKCDRPTTLDKKPEKVCAVVKLGAHGDALFASSVFPGLKEQGYYTVLYCQETTEEVLRHDPNIDKIIRFESRVPMGELGELFRWIETKYKEARILIEAVEGTLLPSPQKIQYHFPLEMRRALCDSHNYVDFHHFVAKVPLFPKRQKFYPSEEEKAWANDRRREMSGTIVALVPNGSSCSKMWPHAAEFAKRLLEREDVTIVHLGDERGCKYEEHPRLKVIGTRWTMRQAMTFAQLADVIVGEETGLLNAVGFEPEIFKVVLLSHSTVENLTRDWVNTVSLREYPVCAPCHRLHYDFTHCSKDEATGAAKCQAMINPDRVLHIVLEYLARRPMAQVIPIKALAEAAA